MHDFYELKEKLVDLLGEYGGKKELSAGDLSVVDTLAHSIKNLCKVIEEMDGGESSMRGGRSNRGGSRESYEGSRNSYEGSYARRGQRRDSMGRFSSEAYSRAADDVVEQLEGMMESAPNERTRMKIKELIREMQTV